MTQHATTPQILNAFMLLSHEEKRALHAAARKHIQGTKFSEPLDLMHEALYLALDGRRRWPIGLNFATFLAMTMRSVAYAERTRSENAKTAAFPVEELLEWTAEGSWFAHPSAEACAQRAQECDELWIRIASASAALSRRDRIAARLLEGMVADEPASELRAELNLCAAEFDAIKKRVLRALRNPARL